MIILKVYIDEDEQKSIDVPVTPESTFWDVLECVKDPGAPDCHVGELWRGRERAVGNDEMPFEVLENWGKYREEVGFFLRQGPPPNTDDSSTEDGRREAQRNGLRDNLGGRNELPGGMDMTLSELQDMASRQQHQIESQQQVLVAKEQRLKFLKQQEQKHQQVYSENEKLKKLRDRVEAQELKLKNLRALRGEVEKHKNGNTVLNSELDSIKTLFNEKEKELALAVAKVEAMTQQLEEIRHGKLNFSATDSSHHVAQLELEKLRKELMLRNKMNDQQKTKLVAQQEILKQRKNESKHLDNRIQELHMRLKKKKAQQGDMKGFSIHRGMKKANANPNIAAVEPYIQHPPKDQQMQNEQQNEKTVFEKQDPKYQTLPPNTKFPLPENKGKDENQNLEINHFKNAQKQQKQSKVSFQNTNSDQDLVNSSDQSLNGNDNVTKQQSQISNKSAAEQRYRHVPPVPPRTGMSGLTHMTPRPFGSTYSTSVLAPRVVASLQQPVISIQDDIRQAGSGQSSPASSDSSNKEGILSASVVKSADISSISYNVQNSNEQVTSFRDVRNVQGPSVDGTAPPLPSRVNGYRQQENKTESSKNISAGASSSQSSSGNKSSDSENSKKLGIGSESEEHTPEKMTVNGSSKCMSAKSNSASSISSENSEGSQKTVSWNKTVHSQDNLTNENVSNNFTSQSSDGQSSKTNLSFGSYPSSQVPVLQKQPLRYASKSVIENTYMGKMGNDSYEKYQKSLNMLYKNLETVNSVKMSSGNDQNEGSQSDSKNSPQSPHYNTLSADKTSNQESSEHLTVTSRVSPEASPKSPPNSSRLDHRHHHHFIIPGSPQNPNIASDKVSYKAHTPKQLRRRHSDSDNEDIGRILHKYVDRKMHSNSDNKIGVVGSENNSSVDTQATSFANHIPERIYIDNMGNMVDSNESNDLPSLPEVADSNSITVVSSPTDGPVLRKKTILKGNNSRKNKNRVSFDPLALLLDASLEGELELVMRCAREVSNVSESNDEGITALHNAICAGHVDIVKFLVEFGCDVNSPDSDGWTPLHCAASCNNIAMVKFLVEHGACIFATTISDQETAAEKCEEDEDGYDGCSEYLYSIQEKLGIMNNGVVYAVFDYEAQNKDEIDLKIGDRIEILRKGDEHEKEWWWGKLGKEGYVPRNLLGLYPRVLPNNNLQESENLR